MTDELHTKPPPRLVDDPAVAPEVQAGLSELAASQLPFDTTAGLSAFEGALGSAAKLGDAARAGGTGSAVSTGTLVAGSVVLMLAGVGMYAWLAPSSPAPRPSQTPPRSAPAELSPPSAAPESQLEAIQPEPLPTIKGEPQRAAATPTPLDREVAAMVKAKALVESKPRAALALLQRLERQYPRGALSEERAGLRVLALWAAGDREAARTERSAFVARYPQSPMRERLMQLEAP